MANINIKDIEKRAKECSNIVFGNNGEPFRWYSRREIRDYIINGKPFTNNVMQYKPIEYKNFGYGGKTKTYEPKIEDIKPTDIEIVIPNVETRIENGKLVHKYNTKPGGFFVKHRVFSLIPVIK